MRKRYKDANKYIITLYNSLALTGDGHYTDKSILKELDGVEVKFLKEIDESKHPNTLLFEIYKDDKLLNKQEVKQEVYSVGGGKITFG